MLLGHGLPRVMIDPPTGPIGYRVPLRGEVADTGVRVQLLVRALDFAWYLQADATVTGMRWVGEVLLGFPDGPAAPHQSRGEYRILAVAAGHLGRTQTRYQTHELPTGEHVSEQLVVYRTV